MTPRLRKAIFELLDREQMLDNVPGPACDDPLLWELRDAFLIEDAAPTIPPVPIVAPLYPIYPITPWWEDPRKGRWQTDITCAAQDAEERS